MTDGGVEVWEGVRDRSHFIREAMAARERRAGTGFFRGGILRSNNLSRRRALVVLAAVLPCSAGFFRAEAAPSQAPAAAPPANVDLRPRFQQWKLETRAQGARGTCSVFAVAGALEYAAAAKTGMGTSFSVEFLNWAAHRTVRRRTDGGFFHELWRGYERYGVCPENALPYRGSFDPDLHPARSVIDAAQPWRGQGLALHWIKPWDVTTGLTKEQFASVKQTLARGWPVCGGFRWPKQERWEQGVLRMCEPSEVFDGHSVLLVGYRDDPAQPGGGVFLIRNSGGNSREGALPYAYAQAYLNDAAWIE